MRDRRERVRERQKRIRKQRISILNNNNKQKISRVYKKKKKKKNRELYQMTRYGVYIPQIEEDDYRNVDVVDLK